MKLGRPKSSRLTGFYGKNVSRLLTGTLLEQEQMTYSEDELLRFAQD